ncbi:MAG: ABC transporter ATP-binding protein [Chloroflexota bacterium]|nr:ABC transporter ATP-binding protein [Chloroflexota bacterium]
MLQVRDLDAAYGKVQILHGVSLDLYPGEVVSVIGPNGAGKSTVLKAVMGILTPSRGEILFAGQSIGGLRTDLVVQRGIGYVPQGRIVFRDMSVVENLEMGAYTVKDKSQVRRTMEQVFGLFPRLAERRKQRAGTLSGGEQQMLAMGRALMASPTLLLLDEPSLGLAPQIVEQIGEIVLEINRMGTSVLLVEQNASMALRVAQYAHVLEVGKVSLSGPAEELANTDQVRELYLGHGAERISGTAAVGRSQHLTRWTG